MAAQRVLAEPDWGWSRGVWQVLVERVTPRGDTYAIDRVSVRRTRQSTPTFIGFVFGRPEVMSGRRWWDYKTGTTEPTPSDQRGAVYPTDSRQHAVCALIEATLPM